MTDDNDRQTPRPASVGATWLVWGMTALLAAIVLWLTLTPAAGPGHLAHPRDKLAHAAGFALLILPTAALRPSALRLVLPLALALGGLIEVIQPFVGRGRELYDFIADAVGLGIGTLAGLWLRRCLR